MSTPSLGLIDTDMDGSLTQSRTATWLKRLAVAFGLLFSSASIFAQDQDAEAVLPLNGIISNPSEQFPAEFFSTPRIIGGSDAEADSWPSLVAIVRSGTFPLIDRFFCGGTVVAEQWVMTAAHCVFGVFGQIVNPASMRVVAGVRNLETDIPDEETIVTNIFVHPEYDNELSLPPYDIALLELATVIDAPVVNLFPGETEDYNGVSSYITGWGATEFIDENNATFPAQLQVATVPLVPLARCNSIVSYQGLVTDRQVCAGFIEGGVDSCAGDSGGPLFIIEDGQIVQVGITSFGNGCALPNFFGIYTSVSHFLPWLDNFIDVPEQDPDLVARREGTFVSMPVASNSGSGRSLNFGATHPLTLVVLYVGFLFRRRCATR